MTDHLSHGSTASFVERNPARYNQTIPEASMYRLLTDPIEFSQNMGRIIQQGVLGDLLMQDAPKQIDDLREQFEYGIGVALRRKDIPAVEALRFKYAEFVTYALSDAREYGVAFGAVKEQLRVGLSGVVDLRNRGLVYGDAQSHQDMQDLRRKHDLPYGTGFGETDYAKIKEDPAEAA